MVIKMTILIKTFGHIKMNRKWIYDRIVVDLVLRITLKSQNSCPFKQNTANKAMF